MGQGAQLHHNDADHPRLAGVTRQPARFGLLLAGLWLAACAGTATVTAVPASPLPAAGATQVVAGTAVVTSPAPAVTEPTTAATANATSAATTPATAAATAGAATAGPGPNGCPDQQAPAAAGPPPDVVLGGQGGLGGGSASLAVRQVLEVRLSAGSRWTLAQQDPAHALAPVVPNGWYAANPPMCVWRFTGQTPGMVTLAFSGRAICAAGSICPQFVLETDFQVTVKQ